ncbi:MAG: hypothetical protein Q9180_007743, partial [Flavoplaca navasiana]
LGISPPLFHHPSHPKTKMFDLPLRPLKDTIFTPLCTYIPSPIKPLHITLLAFISGLISCYILAFPSSTSLQPKHINSTLPLVFWILNRALDCLDGALARHRGTSSELGGFLDLLGDFIVYSLLPISIAYGTSSSASPSSSVPSYGGETGDKGVWLAVAVLEATFHVNNFVLFYVAALVEKVGADLKGQKEDSDGKGERKKAEDGGKGDKERRRKELTSVSMRPAVIEGFESGVIFTLMIMFPRWIEWLSWMMAGLVAVGIGQRTVWVVRALS